MRDPFERVLRRFVDDPAGITGADRTHTAGWGLVWVAMMWPLATASFSRRDF